jgi:hypothetical protein
MLNIGGAMSVQAHRLILSADLNSRNEEAMEANQQAIEYLGEAIKSLGKVGDLLHLGLANLQMALAIFMLCMQLHTIDPVPIMDYLAEAVSLLQEYRDELWMLTLVEKHRTGNVVESWRATCDACREAVAVLSFCQEGDAESEHDYALEAWPWVQRSKSASIAELLSDKKNPLHFMNEQSLSGQTVDLLNQWKALTDSLSSTLHSDQWPKIRQRRRLLKQEMRKFAELRPLFPTWRAEVTLEHLDDSVESSHSVLWIDWVYADGVYFMITARSSSQSEDPIPRSRVSMNRLTVSPLRVDQWIRRHSSSDSLDTPAAEASLSSLQGLLAPLKTLAQKSDLLVFCPTGKLH